MAVTRSWEEKVLVATEPTAPPRSRGLPWLIGASILVLSGLVTVYLAKTRDFGASPAPLNLNTVNSPAQIEPVLRIFSDPAERDAVSRGILDYVASHRPLPNVGALAKLHLPLARLKPLLAVRTPREYLLQFLFWTALFLAAPYGVWHVWRRIGFRGDFAVLPALHLLAGMGLILSVSLRDPLRDTLEFRKFAWGAAAGCLLLVLPLARPFRYERFEKWIYTPLWAGFILFALLLRFGSGPGASDARVNLGPFQPVECIKILLVLFLAGYFTRNWERLRDLREKRLRWIDVPRFAHVLPVLCAVACALALFFLLKDLGPALVTAFLFLAMFTVARGRAGLAILGLLLLTAGVSIGYRLGTPATVVNRISMWLSPWDNDVRGGNQLAHSFWAFATGGLWGSGPGWGDPAMIPAGNTDLVLPSIGEEWGFAGVAIVFCLFAFLIRRALRIALHAPTEYGVFLALGLGALVALEMLLISAGVLGAIPLSGVVSPFLSSGNTAMLANFLIFGLLLAISNHDRETEIGEPFRRPVRRFSQVLGLLALGLLGTAAYYQLAHDQEYIARTTRVFEDDGVKRPQFNPRLNSLAREIRRGNIYDRNGVLLATSDWRELERHRMGYEALEISLDRACSPSDNRLYPFGAAAVQFLGDLRTRENFAASNASLIEHDSNVKLQGYSDYRELVPLVRYRHHPGYAPLEQLRSRDRDVHTALDIRLQMRAASILRGALEKAHKESGAVVVMNPATGDVLALVSEPAIPGRLFDRARYGQYPPGSTFKLVTALAALRLDPKLADRRFTCQRLGDGRVGTRIPGWRRPIRDDLKDVAHGTLSMERAITVSCNAWFAQLGVYGVGAQGLKNMADQLDIPAGSVDDLKRDMPFASYGQGPVLVTPFKMARVAATIAAGGAMPQGRWILGLDNTRSDVPREIATAKAAAFLARAMHLVVTSGTARHAFRGTGLSVAGKTGTAQLGEGLPHSWFAGFAPYGGDVSRSIAFAVMVEHGGYGGSIAAPIARRVVEAAQDLGILPSMDAEAGHGTL